MAQTKWFLRRPRAILALWALSLALLISLIAYAAFALPSGAPNAQSPPGGWLSPDPPVWTPHPTSTDVLPNEVRVAANVRKQRLFIERIRVRHPEFRSLHSGDDTIGYLPRRLRRTSP